MNRWTLVLALFAVGFILISSCSGGNSPVVPGDVLTGNANSQPGQTHLWGYYDVYLDIPSQTAMVSVNRSAMFTANVTKFVNGAAANLAFDIIGIPIGVDYVDVDIDVTIKHPFPGLTQYNGYDVRGIFMGNGSKTLAYNSPDLIFADLPFDGAGPDQQMYDYNVGGYGDIHDGEVGNPDGYTRWFNKTEFGTPGLFGYTPGKFASPGYNPTATLNPYKYFADGLGVIENAWAFVNEKSAADCVFSAGSSCTRNYYLRFPTSTTNVKYGYAIIADWKSDLPADHPSHAAEACVLDIGDTSDVYYASPADKGGKLKLDMSFLRTWGEIPSTVHIESTVLSAPYQLTPSELIPVSGNDTYSTYHVEITADNISGNSTIDRHEFWVIPQYDSYDYNNILGVPNLADDDKLAAFFRYDLYVADSALNQPPVAEFEVVTEMPATGFAAVPVTFHSTSFDPDPGETATLTYYWDFDNDGTFNGPLDTYTGPPTDPVHTYTEDYFDSVSLKVQDVVGNWSNVYTCNPLDITITSCGSFVFPSSFNYYWNGGNYLCTYPCDATRAANPAMVIGCQNGAWTMAAYSPTGGNCSFTLSGSYYIAGTAITSTDRVYFYDSGSINQIYYTDYDNSLGFQNFHTAFSGGAVPSGSLKKICVDDTDNLAALAYTAATTAKIYRYSGSGWDSGVTIPSEFWSACPNYSYITDMDYDPTVGAGGPCYLITYFNSSFHPGIFALKASDGSVLWGDTDIWPSGTFDSTMTCGVEVPMSMSSCHIICFAGKPNGAFNGTYLARYNPIGGEKASTFYTPGSFSSFYGQAALVLDNSVTPNVWKLYGNGSYSNCCISLNLPSGW
ncbi:MAG: PKD domain-containing protein [bacterium]